MLRSRRGRQRVLRRGHIFIFTGGPLPEIRDPDQPGQSLRIPDLGKRLGQASAEARRTLTEHFRATGREQQDWVAAIANSPPPAAPAESPPSAAASLDESGSPQVEADPHFLLEEGWDDTPVYEIWPDTDHNSGFS
jgi:hypothetical protein